MISWLAPRQKRTALNSIETKIIATNEGAKDAVQIEKLWRDLHQERHIPISRYGNEAAKEFSMDSVKFHNKSKDIEIHYCYVRNDIVAMDPLKIDRIARTENPADILTKNYLSTHLNDMYKH